MPTRIFALSDLHADEPENVAWLAKALSGHQYIHDVLILAGDVCDGLGALRKTLQLCVEAFGRVFFCPGNHELWCSPGDSTTNSLEKFHKVLLEAEDMGVSTTPEKIGRTWVAPLFSWYHPSFDPDPTPEPKLKEIWQDFVRCKWPGELSWDSLASYFGGMNKAWVQTIAADAAKDAVVTFSHFLPRRELLPPKEHLRFNLLKVAGDLEIDAQLRQMGSKVHIFGHSHLAVDVAIEGVRYVHNPLGYPEERGGGGGRQQIPGPHLPKLVHVEEGVDSARGDEGPFDDAYADSLWGFS